jgi:sortase A
MSPDVSGRSPRPEVPTIARLLGAVGRGLITTGIVVLLFVVFELWGTNIQEARAQDDLRGEFGETVELAETRLDELTSRVIDAGTTDDDPDRLPSPVTGPAEPEALDEDLLAVFFPDDGDAVARIELPRIGVDKVVVRGVQVDDLRTGPGHYPGTAPVGTAGNASVAGHRTTYGAPFNRIDELQPGDEINVTSVLGRFTYRVVDPKEAFAERLADVDAVGDGHIIVRPGATWVLGDFGDSRLTLTACHPKLSSRQRIIVAAELVQDPATPQFDPEVLAALRGGSDGDPELPGEALGADGERANAVGDLDVGLGGDSTS